MGKRRSLGATYQREKKKKKYTQKLTQKTKNEIANRGKSSTPVRAPSKSVLNSGGGSRVGMKVENKSLDNVKKAVKSVIKHQAKAPSKARLNNSLGGRAGQKTERLKLKSYTSGDGLTKREQGLKFKYKQSGFNGLQVGSKEGKKALESGIFSTKTTKKEKANVAKSIEKDYNRKAKSNTNAFIAGLTKSDVNVKTRAKAITGKDIDTSKVTKKGAYKAGDTVQEVASYFVAPTEAVAGKLGAKAVKATAKKLLKKEAIKAGEKATAKALSKKVATSGAEKIVKDATGKTVAKIGKNVASKEGKQAIKEASNAIVNSKIKKQAIRRGADVIANAPLNARYAVSHADEQRKEARKSELQAIKKQFKSGKMSQEDYMSQSAKVKKKYASIKASDVAKDYLINTGLDIGMGGAIDKVSDVVKGRKIKTQKAVSKYEKMLKKEDKKTAQKMREKAKPNNKSAWQNVGNRAVKGKSVSGAKTLKEGGTVKRLFDNIDKAEQARTISKRQARLERKALTKAVENRTGRIGFAYRGKNGIEYGKATKKGVERITDETFGKSLNLEKRFNGRVKKLEREAPIKKPTKKRAYFEEQFDNTPKDYDVQPIRSKQEMAELEEAQQKAEVAQYGKTEKTKNEDIINREKSKAKSKAAEKRRDVAIRKVIKKYTPTGIKESEETINAVKRYVETGDEEALYKYVREKAPYLYENYGYRRVKEGRGIGSTKYKFHGRTLTEAGATNKDLDDIADSIVQELKEAASKAEPKAKAEIPKKESRLAETDRVYDESPRYDELHPESKIDEKPKVDEAPKEKSSLQKVKEKHETANAKATGRLTGEENVEGTWIDGLEKGESEEERLKHLYKEATETSDGSTYNDVFKKIDEKEASGEYTSRQAQKAREQLSDDIEKARKQSSAEEIRKINQRAEKGEITKDEAQNLIERHKGREGTLRGEDDATINEVRNVQNIEGIPKQGEIDNLSKEGQTARKANKAKQEKYEILEDSMFDAQKKDAEFQNEVGKRQATKDLLEEGSQGTTSNVGATKTAKADNLSTAEEKGLKSSEKTKAEEAVNRVDEHVSSSDAKSGASEGNKATRSFYRKVVDSLGFTERKAKEFARVTGNKEFSKGMTGALNHLRQVRQVANHSFDVEQVDVNMRKVGESGRSILKRIQRAGEYKETQAFLYLVNHAHRVQEAQRKGIDKIWAKYDKLVEKGTMTREQADDLIEKEVEKLTSDINVGGDNTAKRLFDNLSADEALKEAQAILDANPHILQNAKDVAEYFRNDLRSQMLSGIISKDTFYHYIQTYPLYVPAHRAPFGASGVTKVGGKSAVEHVAKGSGLDILPLENQMRMSTDATFMRSATNDVAKRIAEMNGIPTKMQDFLINEQKAEPTDMGLFIDMSDKSNIGTLKFTENGEWREIKVEKDFLRDLEDVQKSMLKDYPFTNAVLKGLAKTNRGFKSLITSYSLPFMVKNFFRDLPEGALQSKNTIEYFKNVPSGAQSILKNDQWYRAYQRSGATHAQFIDPEKVFDERTWLRTNTIDRIERLNEITEQIPRMAEFKAYLKKLGVTPETATAEQLKRASEAAADVTVNFGRSGSVGRLLNSSVIPFFNPAIQGADKLRRVFLNDHTLEGYSKLIAKSAMLGVAPTVLNEMMLAGNKNYEQISARDRMTNYYIPLDKDNPLAMLFGSKDVGAGDGEIMLKIPKARALSVFGAFTQKAMGKLKDAGAGDILMFANDQVGPVGLNNALWAPIVNTMANKTWYGGQLDTDYETKNVTASKRYNANTSSISIGLAKALSKAGIEVSPKRIDNLIDSYTGIAGDFALGNTRKAAQRGILAKAFSTDTVTQSDVQSRYYKKLSELQGSKNANGKFTSKKTQKAYENMDSWNDRIGAIRNAINNVQDSNAKDKAEKVRELTKIRNKLMKNALKGKKNTSVTGDMRSIAKVIGNKKAFEMTASASDKKILKKYGNKADKNFLKGYIAVKELTAGRKGKADKNSVALALASSGAGKKVAKAYGATTKNKDDIKSAYTRAKEYLKNGGSVEEYKAFQKAMNKAKVSKEKDKYLAKAVVLAKSGAKDRAYSMYDIRSDKVRLARNMSAMGISAKDIEKAKQKAYNGGYANKAQAMAYINSLKGSQAKKSVMLEGIYWWARRYGNPYGKVNASAKDAIKKRISVKGKASDDGPEGWVTPHRKGWEINPKTKKRIKNGKTVGSVGERVALPAGRTYKDLKRDEKAGKIKKVTVEERLHNAFGSRIGDVKKKKVYKPSTIKKVEKDKKGNVDIHFANGEAWRNPPSKKPKDNTQLEESGSGRSGRGWRRWRRWRRYGRGGGRGGGSGRVSMPSVNAKVASSPTTKNLKLKGYLKPSGKQGITVRANDLKEHGGLTKSELKALIKASRKSTSAKTKGPKAESKDIYKTRGSQRRK